MHDRPLRGQLTHRHPLTSQAAVAGLEDLLGLVLRWRDGAAQRLNIAPGTVMQAHLAPKASPARQG